MRVFNLLTVISLLSLAGCNNSTVQSPQKGDSNNSAKEVIATVTRKQIVFFGNSITAAYGLDPSESFTTLMQQRIDSLKLAYKVVNAGVSGETSSGGASRIGWVLRQQIDIFVLELGGNDGLRGIPLSETAINLQKIIDSVTTKYPAAKIVLAGMEIPPNLGTKYTKDFHELFPALAKKNNGYLIPFLLEGVGGIDSLNQRDGIHPNAEGEKIVEENAWKIVKQLL